MAYAIDILNSAFDKTKKKFFPVKPKFWMRMGFVSLLGSTWGGGFNGSQSSSWKEEMPADMTFSQFISEANTKALDFLSKNSLIVALGLSVVTILSLILSYINSVFMFVFMDGLLSKDFSVRKSFASSREKGVSLFWARFVIGLVFFGVLMVLFFPLISAFFKNELVSFNPVYLIPIVTFFIVIAVIMGIFWFLVYDFVVPIMYIKKYSFVRAWDYFKKIAGKKKFEIFFYWLVKIGLSIAASIVYVILVVILALIFLVFILIAGLLVFLLRLSSPNLVTIAILVACIFFIILFFVFFTAVITVPIPGFFRMYSIEMVKKLEK